jgi:hypothetical protein
MFWSAGSMNREGISSVPISSKNSLAKMKLLKNLKPVLAQSREGARKG